ncbi:clathrin, putative [Bodo saltans]|uniref:Clathrin, putative n=1 Tax=Bodo saltans TaxID=75058 RepID=A0A0S4IV54_BODSA|nr:clathrin, putative [Bodo saltans]|eukprot:CUG02131.1 clathrin, putative [Bodo saltans]
MTRRVARQFLCCSCGTLIFLDRCDFNILPTFASACIPSCMPFVVATTQARWQYSLPPFLSHPASYRSFTKNKSSKKEMDDDFFASSGPTSEARTATNVFDEVLVAAQPPPKASSQPNSQPNSQPSSPPRPADADAPESPSKEVVAVAAAPVAAPVASPVAPSQSPIAPTNNTAQYQGKVQELQRAINERIAAADKATLEKEDRQKKAAQAYVADEKAKREKKLKIVHEDHRKEQADYEQKTADLKKPGAAWSSLGVVVDLKKPNQFSKKTDRMKQVLLNLDTAAHPQAAPAAVAAK